MILALTQPVSRRLFSSLRHLIDVEAREVESQHLELVVAKLAAEFIKNLIEEAEKKFPPQ